MFGDMAPMTASTLFAKKLLKPFVAQDKTGYALITNRAVLKGMPRFWSSSALSKCKKYFLPLPRII
jgi:hypothetical protein